MARGFNKVILMGNLARDPEVRQTVDRRSWARFTVAVGYFWKDKNGEYQESTDFIPVVAWGYLADRCSRYLNKGSGVLVEGRLSVRSYEAKDGSGRRYVTEVVASDFSFVGGRRSSESSSGASRLNSEGASHFSFSDDGNFGRSIEEKGFSDDFPMDFSEMEQNEKKNDDEVDIPF